MSWEVIHGDCLDVMRGMEAESVDAIVCDPPYGTGAWLRGEAGCGSNPTATLEKEPWDVWDTEWTREGLRVCRGSIVSFCPTTTIGDLTKAMGASGRMFIWLKPDPRPRFAGQAAYGFEPILLFGRAQNFGGMDYIFASSPRVNRDTDAVEHPHQKPERLMRWLCRLACLEGGIILDPFCGSGTTGVAAVREGYNFIGIDQNAGYCDLARQRVANAAAQTDLFTGPGRTAPQPDTPAGEAA